MLAHLPGQVGQYLVSLAYLHFEGSVSHTLDYSSINRDHIFFWNDFTSLPLSAQTASLRASCI
jgi:hypothetical protein